MVYEMIDGYLLMSREVKHKEFLSLTGCRITGEDIENIVISALEGGIGHWAILNNSTPVWSNKPKGLSTSEYATQLLIEGHALKFIDTEDEIAFWELNLLKLIKGCIHFFAANPDFDFEDVDAAVADEIFQYALFNEITFS